MLTLAVDTTGEHGSIALVSGGEVLEEVWLHEPEGFSGVIYREVAALLERQGRELREVELFAAAAGPGSFTGVRIGLAAMKSLAEVNGKLAAGVSNLRVLAALGTAPLRATVIDARRGEVYVALWDAEGNVVQEERVCALEAFVRGLPAAPVEWISSDAAVVATRVGDSYREAPLGLAGQLGVLAREYATVPEALDANYVRRSDAEIFWKED